MSSYGPRIEPGFWEDDRIQQLRQGSNEELNALVMLLEFRSHCMADESDGRIREIQFRRATVHPDPMSAVLILERLGLIERDGEGVWQLDWSRQLTAEQMEAKRTRDADWNRHLNGNHSACGRHPKYDCHKNGDYVRYQNLGDRDGKRDGRGAQKHALTDNLGDLDGDRVGAPTRLDETRPDLTGGKGVGDVEERSSSSSSTDGSDSALARSADRRSSSSPDSRAAVTGSKRASVETAPDRSGVGLDPWDGPDEDFDFLVWESNQEITDEQFDQALRRELRLTGARYQQVPNSVTAVGKGRTVEFRLRKSLWRAVQNRREASANMRGLAQAAFEVVTEVLEKYPGLRLPFDANGNDWPLVAEITDDRLDADVLAEELTCHTIPNALAGCAEDARELLLSDYDLDDDKRKWLLQGSGRQADRHLYGALKCHDGQTIIVPVPCRNFPLASSSDSE
ncbi:hypothetical protein [Nocardia sp. NPDC051750]|uniref:hypothetical protein n=1 Tax=Nocardia sp. NPDC051750 TaxID=3364325 RepID=UPI003789B3C1